MFHCRYYMHKFYWYFCLFISPSSPFIQYLHPWTNADTGTKMDFLHICTVQIHFWFFVKLSGRETLILPFSINASEMQCVTFVVSIPLKVCTSTQHERRWFGTRSHQQWSSTLLAASQNKRETFWHWIKQHRSLLYQSTEIVVSPLGKPLSQ